MKKIVLISLLLINCSITAAQSRDLIMILDRSEVIDRKAFEKESVFGAISQSLLAALAQKAAPILVTQPILRTALLPTYIEPDENKALERFPFLKENWARKILTSNKSVYKNFRDAALINFKYNDWIIRQVIMANGSNDLFFLIPRNYKNISELKSYVSSNAKKSGGVTNLEFALGLKIEHMAPVSEQQLLAALQKNNTASEEEIFAQWNKEAFFVLDSEYRDAHKESAIPRWNIYLTGHGSEADLSIKKEVKKEVTIKPEETLKKELDALEQDFNKMGKASKDKQGALYFTPKKMPQKSELKKVLDTLNRIQTTLRSDKKYQDDIVEDVGQTLKETTDMLADNDLENGIAFLYVALTNQKIVVEAAIQNDIYEEEYQEDVQRSASGLIAGIPIPDFKTFLQFLDKKITVSFLYYSSCYAGGKNLQELYNASIKNLTGDTYSFIIASNGFLDAPSTIAQFMEKNDKLRFDQNFRTYFDRLADTPENEKTPLRTRLEQAISSVTKITSNQAIGEQASNLSHIKFPGLEFTQTIAMKNIETITEVMAITRDKPLDITAEIILVYPSMIPFPVNVTLPEALFVSMVPGEMGKMYHIFNEVNVTTKEKPLKVLSDAFLGIEALHAEKIFWLKQVNVNNKLALKNVFFVYNGTNPNVPKTNAKKMVYYTDARGKQFWAGYSDQSGGLSALEEYRSGDYVKAWHNYLSQTFGAAYEKANRDISALKKIEFKVLTEKEAEERLKQREEASSEKVVDKNLDQNLDKLARAFAKL